MPDLNARIENALNETRILLLGGQVLLGFSYRPYFESSFSKLSWHAQVWQTIGVGVMTLGLVWLMIPASFHQMVERGEDTARLHRFTTRILDWGLLPFALGLAIYGYVIAVFMHFEYAISIGLVVGLLALAFWYLFPFANYDGASRARVSSELRQEEEKQRKQGGTEIKEKIKTLLMECRMVLPGVQALLGFQLTTFFMQGFEKLPQSSKLIHCGGLAATTLATVLIITPAAYHRIAEAGEDTEHLHWVGTRLLLASMVFLGIGLNADFVVILRSMGISLLWSGLIALLLLLCAYALWFGFALVRKQN